MRSVYVCDDDSRAARLTAALAEELENADAWPEGQLWWLSFVDPTLAPPLAEQEPGGRSFLGVTVVDAIGPIHAIRKSHELGANPGGEVQVSPVPEDFIPLSYRDRLLSREDLAELGEL